MKSFNMSAKSLYVVFSDYEKDYVRIAAQSFSKEVSTFSLIIKAYGANFDGEGRELITSYLENERLKSVLLRIESRIKVIKVLMGVHNYSESKILKLFYTKKDTEILAITRGLLSEGNKEKEKLILTKQELLKKFGISESILGSALDYVDDSEKRSIYLYFYGIERPKLPMAKILKIFPKYNESKINNILLEIQKQIPDLLMRIPEDEKKEDMKTIPSHIGNPKKYSTANFKHNTFFEYIYTDTDKMFDKVEKKNIILYYMKLSTLDPLRVIPKIFGPTYDRLNSDLELSTSEYKDFKTSCDLVNNYVNDILNKRRNRFNAKKISDTDRVIKSYQRLKHRLLHNIDDVNLDTLSKKDLNIYLSEFFRKYSEYESFLSEFYDMNTMILLENKYVSNMDLTRIKEIFDDLKDYLNKRINLSEYPSKFIDYFISNSMKEKTKTKINDLILDYLNNNPSLGQKVAAKLWGEKYDLINVDVDITEEEKKYLNELINKINNHIEGKDKQSGAAKRGRKSLSSFLDFFVDPESSEEEKNNIRKRVIAIINHSPVEKRELVIKYYGENYDNRNDRVMDEKDKRALQEYKKYIKNELNKSFEIKNSFKDYFVSGYISKNNECRLVNLLNEFMNKIEHPGKQIALKLYGEKYDILNKDVVLSFEETLSLTELISLARQYIKDNKNNNVSYHSKRTHSFDYFFDFLVTDNQTVDELHESIFLAQKYLRKSSSKRVDLAKSLYGEDFGKLKCDNITNGKKQILNSLRKDIRGFIATNSKYKKEYTFGCKPRFIDYFLKNNKDFNEKEIVSQLLYYLTILKIKGYEIILKIYGEKLDQFNAPSIISVDDKIYFYRSISYINYLLKKSTLEFDFKEDFLSYFYDNLDNRDNKIKKLNNYLEHLDNKCIDIIRYCYDKNFKLVRTIKLTKQEFNGLNNIISQTAKLIKSGDHIIDCQTNSKVRLKNRYIKLYFFDYFKKSPEDIISEEKKEIILNTLNNSNSIYISKLKEIYGEDCSEKAKYTIISAKEKTGINHIIKQINKVLDGEKVRSAFRLPANFIEQFYLDSDTEKDKEAISQIVKEYIKNRKTATTDNSENIKIAIDIINTFYDENYNLKNSNKLTKNQKASYKSFVNAITNLVQKHRDNKTRKKAKEYFFDYFVSDGMSEIDIAKIPYIFEIYRLHPKTNKFGYFSILYDENYHLKDDVEITDDLNNQIRSDIKYFKSQILKKYLNKYGFPNRGDKKDSDSTSVAEAPEVISNMMDLGNNSYLALQNDLFELEMIMKEVPEIESDFTDELIMKTYLEVSDSKTIMDLLRISEDILVDFYLNNLDKIDDISEPLRFIINSSNKDVLKKLFVTPLFLRVVNDLTDIERQIIYLKLVQIKNEAVTDELISNITQMPIDLIRKYVIMTREDKVNELNNYILKNT